MRHKGWLFGVILITAGLFIIKTDFQNIPTTVVSVVRQRIVPKLDALTTPQVEVEQQPSANSSSSSSSGAQSSSAQSGTSQSASSQSTAATPMEENVQGKTLATTYYYHFNANTPQSVKRVFEQAVTIYNQTKLVNLVAGAGSQSQNQIAFGTYKKVMSAAEQGTIELGVGGPGIIQRVGYGAYTANHAQASLNINYTTSISLAVALHELGHALGLAHSTDKTSVMYPMDQGVTTLSQGDLNGLKQIYKE
ncbi:matrixin family metalloprotease [Loigolactobacillus backii]|uniref:matrixin family metalloprotease n=1 Tax=Loigolactobacillus backii TaxID=375175 RepID=UPI000830CF6F|nr:matrixin family metalloprotease [Loigolactobacillus backii]MDA5387767.1 matrixin family metalloprotease [Loigolactobacillus backii]MDA5390942.1 matrixin family metalloprotease [Loigolactobacillus backii]